MKVTIRRGTFETNSSSTHAIVIDVSGDWVNPRELPTVHHGNGRVTTNLSEIGLRDVPDAFDIIADPKGRAEYIWTAVHWIFDMLDPNHVWPNVDRFLSELYGITIDPKTWRVRLSESVGRFLEGNQDIEIFDAPLEPRFTRFVDSPLELLPLVKSLYVSSHLLDSFLFGRESFVVITGDDDYDVYINKLNKLSCFDDIRNAMGLEEALVREGLDETSEYDYATDPWPPREFRHWVFYNSDRFMYTSDEGKRMVFVKGSSYA